MKYAFDDSAFETWVDERDSYADRTFRCASKNLGFYSSPAWKMLREKVLSYYGRECMKCRDAHGISQVDHIKPRSWYPALELDFNNMQVLCMQCNKDKGSNTADYRANKYLKVK